jgi:hypothetical protein
MSKPVDQADLAFYPLIIICRGSPQTGVEKLMASPHNIDRDGKTPVSCLFDKLVAELPGNIFVEHRELEFLFFLQQLF